MNLKIRWTFVTLAAALAALPAAAQEDDGSFIRTEKPSISVVSDCKRPTGLCLRPKVRMHEAPSKRRATLGSFDKVTRLAGMFMGRVQAAEVGPFRLRVKLDLR